MGESRDLRQRAEDEPYMPCPLKGGGITRNGGGTQIFDTRWGSI